MSRKEPLVSSVFESSSAKTPDGALMCAPSGVFLTHSARRCCDSPGQLDKSKTNVLSPN